MIEYLGEIETEFENTLGCLSGAQMGSNHEKNRGRKSRDTLPLIVSPEVDRCRGTFIACLAVDRCKMDIHRVSVCLHCPKRIQIF